MIFHGRIYIWLGRAIFAAVFLYMPCVALCQQVEIKTQKDVYSRDEKIAFTFNNTLPMSVFTVVASSSPELGLSNIERKASIGWDALPLRCRRPSCKEDYTIPAAQEVKPGTSVTFSWLASIYDNGRYVRPEPGTYRVAVLYQVKKSKDSSLWNWTTVRSNVFTLE